MSKVKLPLLPLAGLLLAALPPRPACAEDVYLTNGESFEGVAAEMAGDQVRILMAGGEMRLPRSLVLRIEESEAPYRRYLEREAHLEASPESTAGDWRELSAWALGKGLKASARQAAVRAADLDPDLPQLPPLMRRLGYVREAASGLWLPREQAVRRYPAGGAAAAGDGGGELRRQVSAEIRRAADEARQREEEIAAARRQAAEEVRRVFEEARPAAPAPRFRPGLYATAPVAYAVPVGLIVVHGGVFTSGPAPPQATVPASRAPVLDALERQPGSLLPGLLDLSR